LPQAIPAPKHARRNFRTSSLSNRAPYFEGGQAERARDVLSC
jgi:hypothetical protein